MLNQFLFMFSRLSNQVRFGSLDPNFYPDLLSSTNIKQNKINAKKIFWTYLTYIIIGPDFKNTNKMVECPINIVGHVAKLT